MQNEVSQLNQVISKMMTEKSTKQKCACRPRIRDLERQVLDLHRQLFYQKCKSAKKSPHSIKSRSMSRVRDDETRSSLDVTPKNNNKNTTIRKMKTSSNAQEYHNSGEVKVQMSEIQKVIPKSRSQSRSNSKNRSRSKGKYSSTLQTTKKEMTF